MTSKAAELIETVCEAAVNAPPGLKVVFGYKGSERGTLLKADVVLGVTVPNPR